MMCRKMLSMLILCCFSACVLEAHPGDTETTALPLGADELPFPNPGAMVVITTDGFPQCTGVLIQPSVAITSDACVRTPVLRMDSLEVWPADPQNDPVRVQAIYLLGTDDDEVGALAVVALESPLSSEYLSLDSENLTDIEKDAVFAISGSDLTAFQSGVDQVVTSGAALESLSDWTIELSSSSSEAPAQGSAVLRWDGQSWKVAGVFWGEVLSSTSRVLAIRTDALGDSIELALSNLHGEDVDLCATGGLYGDGICDAYCLFQDVDCHAIPAECKGEAECAEEEEICAREHLYGNGFCDEGCPLPDPDCEPEYDRCAEQGLYGDDQCDLFCSSPDPDCEGDLDICAIEGRYSDGHCDLDCPRIDWDCAPEDVSDEQDVVVLDSDISSRGDTLGSTGPR
ncbi:MAG: hypothetical protein KC561_14925, partial [Myxococcales bacterium]|nr:hypothetical protein [Myxococcales bacterium]